VNGLACHATHSLVHLQCLSLVQDGAFVLIYLVDRETLREEVLDERVVDGINTRLTPYSLWQVLLWFVEALDLVVEGRSRVWLETGLLSER
jgi:hypothetical protein